MKIGLFRGKEIADMDRDELLEYAKWSVMKIEALQKIEADTQDMRIEKEIQSMNRGFFKECGGQVEHQKINQ